MANKEFTGARQGDVFVFKVKALPADIEPVEPTGNAYVVALGETSVHRHQLFAKGAKLFRRGSVQYLEISARGGALLEVTTDRGAPIVPPRHEPVTLPPGLYSVRIQMEWTADRETARVQD